MRLSVHKERSCINRNTQYRYSHSSQPLESKAKGVFEASQSHHQKKYLLPPLYTLDPMNIPFRFLEKIAMPDTSIEVSDNAGLALLHMPWEQVLRQNLPFKLVVLALCNNKGHIYLKKKTFGDKRKKQALWGLDITPVQGNEARLDAVFRISQGATGVQSIQPVEIACLPMPEAPHINLTYFLATMPGDLPPMPDNEVPLMLVDGDEMEGLLETVPESLAPEVHILAQATALFDGAPNTITAFKTSTKPYSVHSIV